MTKIKDKLLANLRDGKKISNGDILRLIVLLSIPAIFANLSTIIMQYIDAAMVGHFSSEAAAAIGLMATCTWLLGGLSMAASIGFSVQLAQAVGAKEEARARQIVRLGLFATFCVSLCHAAVGAFLAFDLPAWLGGAEAIRAAAGKYFFIYCLSLPLVQLNSICGGLLQAGGNMKTPSLLHILMGLLDVIFNGLLIFPGRLIDIASWQIPLPGAGLGLAGAALGTLLAELIVALLMLRALLFKAPLLSLRRDEKLEFSPLLLKNAFKIAVPVAFEQLVLTGGQIVSTKIVAPLGLAALAANSFSVTIEGLCYMPGFGVAAAATTLLGQSIGAKRQNLASRFAHFSAFLGIAIMGIMGGIMYLFAPQFIASLSPDRAVQELAVVILRIEALCEPLYGAAIVAIGIFRGAGDTLAPSCINLLTMWLIRLPLAFMLVELMGLKGVWIAMATELSCRGLWLLGRVYRKYSYKITMLPKYLFK